VTDAATAKSEKARKKTDDCVQFLIRRSCLVDFIVCQTLSDKIFYITCHVFLRTSLRNFINVT